MGQRPPTALARWRWTRALLGGLLAVTTANASALAQTIAVTPGQLVLTPATRAGTVTVTNGGEQVARLRVSLADYAMASDGRLRTATAAEATGWSAAGRLRFAPRSLTLAPGDSGAIQVAASLDPTAPDSSAPDPSAPGSPREWRSHLLVTLLPPPETGPGLGGAATPMHGAGPRHGVDLSVALQPVYSYGLPVFVRLGRDVAPVAVTLDAVGEATVTVTLAATGAHSRAGTLVASPSVALDDPRAVRRQDVVLYPQAGAVTFALPWPHATPPAVLALVDGTGAVLGRWPDGQP